MKRSIAAFGLIVAAALAARSLPAQQARRPERGGPDGGTRMGMGRFAPPPALAVGDRPFAEDLKGNVEIRPASIEYRRKGDGR